MGLKRTARKSIDSLVMLFKKKQIVAIPTPVADGDLLKGKVALITGGSGGIGYEIAKEMLRNGCRVIIAGTNEQKLERMSNDLHTPNVKYIVIIVIDVTEIQSLKDKVDLAKSMFESGRIDILANSAGVLTNKEFFDIDEDEYNKIMDINVKGCFFMSQIVAEYMISKNIKGHILNVSSSSALRPAWSPYQISKWAIRGFTLGLADTLLPHGITVNAIAPGPTTGPMAGITEKDNIYNPNTPIGRFAIPAEIARLAVFMVSDMGNMIVGDTFYMTGGSGTISYKL